MNSLLITLVGILVSIISFLTQGGFDPFILLGFIFVALFELILKKQKKVLFGCLPWICGFILVMSIKLYIIDFKVSPKDIPELKIPKNSRIFYQPSMFRLKLEDLIFYKSEGNPKNYLAVLKGIKNNLYSIYILSKKEFIDVPKEQIKGKVLLIVPSKVKEPFK